MDKDYKKMMFANAESIGKQNMMQQVCEECGELIKAICKYNRSIGIGQITETTQDEAMEKLIEEVVDVEICIESLKYLMNIDGTKEKTKAIEKVYNRYN